MQLRIQKQHGTNISPRQVRFCVSSIDRTFQKIKTSNRCHVGFYFWWRAKIPLWVWCMLFTQQCPIFREYSFTRWASNAITSTAVLKLTLALHCLYLRRGFEGWVPSECLRIRGAFFWPLLLSPVHSSLLGTWRAFCHYTIAFVGLVL